MTATRTYMNADFVKETTAYIVLQWTGVPIVAKIIAKKNAKIWVDLGNVKNVRKKFASTAGHLNNAWNGLGDAVSNFVVPALISKTNVTRAARLFVTNVSKLTTVLIARQPTVITAV